jgi:hypothetical protein
MRAITFDSVQAFRNNETRSFGNTRVKAENGVTKLFLHDNLIAIKENGVVRVSNAGWSSNTTKERLNGLHGVNIRQKNFVWYLNGEEWDGDWKEVR